MSSPRLKTLLSFLAASLLLSLLAACSGDDDSGRDRVSVQLDWTPNTNHIGIYVALAQGWYRDEGIDVDILPYTDAANADAIVANGQADFGVTTPASVIFSRAAGLELISAAAILQSSVTELAVLESSSIQRPRDFDGKTYAGFGLPFEGPQIKTVIRADGGVGEFETATLSTAAYEALYNGRADFTEIYTAWEGIEAAERGIKLRTWRYDSFGVPDFPGVVLVARQSDVESKEDVYSRFLAVTRRGFEFAAENPDEATDLFLNYLPSGNRPDEELVRKSTHYLASIYVDSAGAWGHQSVSKWESYTRWLLGQNVVVDAQDRIVTSLPGGALFTNELISSTGASTSAP